ncbi:hypothetical protein CLU79DRAFT_755787 [Phycomyces nitens]|nr:hypothetical protein CLU79DRAFT_755787 [Phycomyces nitens]
MPCLLGGKRLTGVLPPDKQPPPYPSIITKNSTKLVDIESCIDDPSLAPLGHHVYSRTQVPRQDSEEKGQVEIQKKQTKELHNEGLLMLRRRGLEADELSQHLESLLPPLTPSLPNYSHYRDLLELDISRNKLKTLPANIGLLHQLKILDVSSNLLSEIPPELYNLSQLQVLVLSQNNLHSIPRDMPLGLRNLVTLRISGNKITRITSRIKYWRKMRHLQLGSVYGGNLLSRVPNEISEMESLEELDISHNQIKALPSNMQISTLEHLNVSSNQLESLPPSVANCTKLKTLNVSKNHLTTLPADLVELKHLELLDISENLLCIIPADILEQMPTTLLITGNPMTRPGNCNLSASTDAYARILQRMTQQGVPRIPTPCWKERDRCGPKGMGCESPATTPLIQSPRGRDQEDEDAVIDRELSYLAQQLNVLGSRPQTPLSRPQTPISPPRTPLIESSTTHSQSVLPPSPELSIARPPITPGVNLIHSLRETCCRVILRQQIKFPHNFLPIRIEEELMHKARLCSACQKAFLNEWITSVQVKSYKGHPAVVHRVRFCSTKCWLSCLDSEKEKSVLVCRPLEREVDEETAM